MNIERAEISDFSKELKQVWGTALDTLEMFISISIDSGAKFNARYSETKAADDNQVFQALRQLHARACQVALEIHLLLSNGYADGAHARWRTLHEITVIASFLYKHGNHTAEKYLAHADIDTYKAIVEHQKHCSLLGWEPFSEKEFDNVKTQRDKLLTKFGDEFDYEYGWPQDALNNRRPNFTNIEQNADLEHYRPLYKMASSNVHASSKGIAFRLGLLPDSEVLLCGPSLHGLCEPGQNTVHSLLNFDALFLLIDDDLDNLILIDAAKELANDVRIAFDEADMYLATNGYQTNKNL